MIPSGIELATFRFVAQHLNHCAIAVPLCTILSLFKYLMIRSLQYILLILRVYSFLIYVTCLETVITETC